VNVGRALAAQICVLVAIGLAACAGTAPKRAGPSPNSAIPPGTASPPPAAQSAPDAVPHAEPRSRYGNPPFYDVFGKRYYVLSSSTGYVERGVASWYGPGFHKERTSTGEPYDMYGMTAAHKSLPLPAYVRVTNLQNGRSVVVRVNDRGPFVGNRIIDLSYTAAAKLDMLHDGTAMVEIRTIDPGAPAESTSLMAAAAAAVTGTAAAQAAPATPAPTAPPGPAPAVPVATAPAPAALTTGWVPLPPDTAPATGTAAAVGTALFVQAGAFADPVNAERLAAKLRGDAFGKVFVREDQIAGRLLYRVRIGPVPDVAQFDRIVAALERAGIGDAHLALD
jgi:rare lipoprotein A